MNDCDSELLFHDVMGELHGPAHRSLQEHLHECAPCRLERQKWSTFVRESRDAENAPIINREENPRSMAKPKGYSLHRLASIAATVLLAVGIADLAVAPKDAGTEKAALLDKLSRYQQEDGSWAGQVETTALATIAMIDSGSLGETGANRGRMEQAVHFLTRSGEADARGELLRAIALIKESSRAGNLPNPQLQRALDHAIRRTQGELDAENASLLRELVLQAKREGLDIAQGERVLGSFFVTDKASLPARTDWIQVSQSIARHNVSQPRGPAIELACSLLAASR